jgi:excisionase family DNA binding protein
MAEVLTIDEAALRLKLKPDTVRDWVKAGKLKAVKLGRVWRVDAEDLERLLRGEPTAPPPPLPAADGPLERRAALVRHVQALDKQGLTLRAIAQRLNDEGIPTISGKGRWQQGTIGNLLAPADG